MICLVISDDLMFSQMVSNALPGDASIRSASTQAAAEGQFDETIDAVIVDLGMPVDLQSLASSFQRPRTSLIGIASHVHKGKIDAARSAGFNKVLTRSQTADQLAESFSKQ